MIKWLKHRYLELVFWWNKRRWERLLDAEFRPTFSGTEYQIFQDDTERKYAEGMATVKHKINSMTTSRTKEEYEKVLEDVKELIKLAREETPSQRALRKLLTSMARLPEKSKKQMIDERIQHYKELHEYNKQRDLIKQIKQARKEGKEELANELEAEWREKYGQIRNRR